MSIEAVESVGQEWVTSHRRWWGGNDRPYPGAIAIQTNYGVLLLVRVERVLETGEIRRVLIKPEELHDI